MFIATLELLLQLGKVPKWFNDEVVRMKAAHLVDKTVSAVHPVRTFGSRTGLLSMSWLGFSESLVCKNPRNSTSLQAEVE